MKLIRLLVVWAALCLAAPLLAQQSMPSLETNAQAEAFEAVASRAEAATETGTPSTFALGRLRDELTVWRDRFLADQDINAGRLATIDSQIAALGDTDATEVVARRDLLNAQRERLLTPVLLANEAYARVNGLISEIDTLIRSRDTDRLTSRDPTPLNPVHWPDAVTAITGGLTTIATSVATRMQFDAQSGELLRKLPLVLVYLAVALILLLRGRQISAHAQDKVQSSGGRWRAIWAFVLSLGQIALPTVGLIALVLALGELGLLDMPGADILAAVFSAVMVIVVGRWLIGQLFPASPAMGPLRYDAETRTAIGRAGFTLALGLAASIILNEIAGLSDPTPVAFAAATGPLLVLNSWLTFRLGRLLMTPPVDVDSPIGSGGRVRKFIGRITTMIAVAVPVLAALGYAAAAKALLVPAILSLAVLGVVIILQKLVADIYAPPGEVVEDEVGPLMPVLIGFGFLTLALPVLALIWGARTSDLVEVWTRFREGLTLGDTRLSPEVVLTFLLVFGLGYGLTRFIQSTLRKSVLPRTRLDLGAQNAAVSGLGYVGIFIAAVVAITSAGIDLSNLAIVAGALSVGIGFGLQNIVQNFVSGIILLIERPIGEGDMIAVNGEMGFVRDISVRSTRIETFDRTDVIIPNADLVSGQVTNWTRGNAVGRLILPVGVAYGTDVELVKGILMEVAETHPMVLLDPPPQVLFMTFGASSLDFEIRAILRDVNWKLVTASEMNEEINKRFAAAGIEIPFVQRDLWLRNPEALNRATKGDDDT